MFNFEITGKLNFDDYIRFTRFYNKDVFFKPKRLFLFCIIAIILIFFLFLETIDSIQQNKPISINYIIPVVLYFSFLLFLYLNTFIFTNTYKKYFDSNKTFQEELIIQINENEMNINYETSKTKITKDKINKIMYTSEGIYLFTSIKTAFIIPKRFFNNPNDFQNCMEFIKSHY